MDFYMRLPRDHREFALFLLIVSLISVNLIAPLISMFELGFSFVVWQNTLRVLPFIWLAVVILVILTQKPAGKLKDLIVHPKDSFRSQITINWAPVSEFFGKWSRNFSIAFLLGRSSFNRSSSFIPLLFEKGDL